MASVAALLAKTAAGPKLCVLGAAPSAILSKRGSALAACGVLYPRSFSSGEPGEKDEMKQRGGTDIGSTIQEGAEGKRAAAESAGYERAGEAGERVREAGSLGEAVQAGAGMMGDAAKGAGEFVENATDMGREAAGRGSETAKGLSMGPDKSENHGGQQAPQSFRNQGQESNRADASGSSGSGNQGKALEIVITPTNANDERNHVAGSYSSSHSQGGL